MSRENTNENNGHKGVQKPRMPKPVRKIELADLRQFIDTLDVHVTPSIVVNGPNHPTAVLTVDFGTPIVAVRLSNEQGAELTRRMRSLTRDLFKEEVNIRVSSDHQNGVYWSSVV